MDTSSKVPAARYWFRLLLSLLFVPFAFRFLVWADLKVWAGALVMTVWCVVGLYVARPYVKRLVGVSYLILLILLFLAGTFAAFVDFVFILLSAPIRD